AKRRRGVLILMEPPFARPASPPATARPALADAPLERHAPFMAIVLTTCDRPARNARRERRRAPCLALDDTPPGRTGGPPALQEPWKNLSSGGAMFAGMLSPHAPPSILRPVGFPSSPTS